MSQDSDVDRVAAALNGPVIRYRTFGNGPTRPLPRPAEQPAPAAMPPDTAPAATPPDTAIAPPEPRETPAPPMPAEAAPPPPVAATTPPPVPQPAAAPVAARVTADTLLMSLREDARRELRSQEPVASPRSLLDQLRQDADATPPVADGLLALLASPPAWDMPRAAPPAPVPPPLVGQPILPWTPVEVPAEAPAAMPVAAQPAPPAAPPPPASLAAMFRLVGGAPDAAPPPPPAADRTASLRDVLRGLRPAGPG